MMLRPNRRPLAQLIRVRVRGSSPARGIISPITRHRASSRGVRWLLFVGLLFGGAAGIFPLYWLLTSSVKSTHEVIQFPPTLWPQSFALANFDEAWSALNFVQYFGNSVILAGGLLVLRVGICVLAAYALAKLDVPGKSVIMALLLGVLMVPAMTYFVPQFAVVSSLPIIHVSLINTWWAVWLPGISAPVVIYLLKQFFEQIPSELTDAAALDGAGSFRTLTHIVLPLSKPIIAVVSVFTVTSGWREFLWPLLVLPNQNLWPLEVVLYHILSWDVPVNVQMAANVIATLPMVAIFLAFQKQIMGGIAMAGVKG